MKHLRHLCWRLSPRGRYAYRALRRAQADRFDLAAERLIDVINGGPR